MTGRWFYPGTPVLSTNKIDHHDIAEILLKVALNTINHKPSMYGVLNIWNCLMWVDTLPFVSNEEDVRE